MVLKQDVSQLLQKLKQKIKLQPILRLQGHEQV